jgi:uncharacterized protein YcbK (DUF882 family)
LALSALLVVLANTDLQDAIANGDTRTIALHHTHTDEDISITFKRNGRYDDDALRKLNHFLRDWRVDESTRMDPRLFDLIWEVHREVGGTQPIHVISAYRSVRTNSMLRRRSRGVAQYSQHTVGHAMDFFIPGVALADIRAAGLRLQRGGVGFYPTSGSPFVHLDTGGIRHWPRMTRDQLARVFPDGKTVHIPSDGQPLSGYALALAEVERRGSSPSAVSLAAARNAGVVSGDYEPVPVRAKSGNVLARLFGFQKEEDDDADEPVSVKPRAAPAVIAQARPESVAVPLPQTRPARSGEFRVASAQPAATDVINARGYWRGEGSLPAPQLDVQGLRSLIAESESLQPPHVISAQSSGQRLAWVTGPQGQPVSAGAPMPRPRRLASASATIGETTASVRLPRETGNDRVPANLVLAYAANPGTEMGESVASASRAGRISTGLAKNNKLPSPLTPSRAGQRADNPWLRGLVLAPDVARSLNVAVMGAPDYRQLRPLIYKPRTAVAMVFSRDPHLGMTSDRFSGGAIAFIPTVTFIRTASLY